MIVKYLNECAYKVSNPYSVFDLLAVTILTEKYPQDLLGDTPILGATKPPSTHLKKRCEPISPDIILKTMAKNRTCNSKNEFKNQRSL